MVDGGRLVAGSLDGVRAGDPVAQAAAVALIAARGRAPSSWVPQAFAEVYQRRLSRFVSATMNQEKLAFGSMTVRSATRKAPTSPRTELAASRAPLESRSPAWRSLSSSRGSRCPSDHAQADLSDSFASGWSVIAALSA